MDRPVQVLLDPEQRRRARRRAADQGLTLSAYIVRLVADDLEAWMPEADGTAVIPVADEASLPDHEGMYIGEAVAARMNKPGEPKA